MWATTEVAAPGMGVLSSSGGKWSPYVVPGFDGSKVVSHTLFIDREHSLWIGTTMNGLYRVNNGSPNIMEPLMVCQVGKSILSTKTMKETSGW